MYICIHICVYIYVYMYISSSWSVQHMYSEAFSGRGKTQRLFKKFFYDTDIVQEVFIRKWLSRAFRSCF